MEQNCFNDLRVHVLTRLLWKPELDDQLEINRFCQLYYGPAAPQVLAYLELMHDENVWDWRNWPERDGKSKWASREYEESWDWFGDVPAEDFPEPHFYTLYHTRPPLQEPFFTRGNQLLNQALQAVEGKQIYHRRLEEWRMSFYYAVLSYPPEDDRLIEEAREWLKPRFEQLKKHYQGKVFNGLDQLGLAWPEPLERMTAC